jgi:DNA polymerase-3 subunit delta
MRVCRILAALEAAGEGLPLLLWQLGEDVHALAAVLAAAAGGMPVDGAVRSARVWGKRQAAMERAARRVAPAAISRLLTRLARLDALAKGIGRGNPWDELRELALLLAGKKLPAAA